MGTYHACNHVVNGSITIGFFPDDCKVCQEEAHKSEYYDCRWLKMKTNTLFAECAEKGWEFETFVRSVFVQDVKKKKNTMNDIQVVTIAGNLRAYDMMTKTQNVSKFSGVGNGFEVN